MSQNNSRKNSNMGRSRARGSAANGRKASSRPKSTTSSRNNTGSKARRSSSQKRGGPDYDFKKIALGGVILIAAIACITFLVRGMTGGKGKEEETETTTIATAELEQEVLVDGISITGLSMEEARAALENKYSWALKIAYQDESYEVTNLASSRIEEVLREVYTGTPKDSYTLDFNDQEEAIQAEAAAVAAKWDKKPKNGSISSYDASSDKFLFTGAETGIAIDQNLLISEIKKALQEKSFDRIISATASQVEPEFSETTAKERYKTIGTFTTKTTANSNRNTNVKLSAQAINGTVIQPGEEFSFNKTVGQRTAEKGYKPAAAYNNSEVVDEIGGGICQVSSTLFNTVLRSGLKTTLRRSHTYEPSYVTPGSDAAVSWGGPDYKFVNNSNAAIGIRASYSDRICTISIYGIPVLEEGVTYGLESKKLKDIDPPAPTYEEDQTLQPGVEKAKSNGSKGSYWETRLVIKKNGELVSQDVDHNTTYRGHPPVILRNTSGVVIPGPESTETTQATTIESTPAPEGAGDGLVPPTESSPEANQNPSGPGSGPGQSGTTEAQGPGVSAGPGTNQPTETSPAPAPTTAGAPPPATAPVAPPSGSSDIPMITPIPGA